MGIIVEIEVEGVFGRGVGVVEDDFFCAESWVFLASWAGFMGWSGGGRSVDS